MKIISKVNTTNWTYKYFCNKCDTELEVEKSDVRIQHYDGDMREPPFDAYYSTCPVCYGNIAIPETKIPKAVRVEIQQKRTSTTSKQFDR